MTPHFRPLRISALLAALLCGSVATAYANEADTAFATPLAPVSELTPQILYQFMFAEIAATRGQVPLSVAAYVDLARTTQDPRIARRAAEVALLAKQYDAALQATRIWVERAPDDAAAQQMAVTLAAAFGRLDEVALHLQRSLELDPANLAPNLMRLSRLLARINDKAAAYRVVEQATAPYLTLPEAHMARAQAAYAAKDVAAAQRDVDVALNLRPDWEFAAILKALLVQAQPAEVISVLAPFVRANPQASDARLGLARAYVSERRFDDALQEFKALLARQPDNVDVMYATGLLSLQAHDVMTAEPLFIRLLELRYAESNLLRTYLGQIAEERKDFAAAAKWYAGVTPGAQYLSAQARAAQLTARMGNLEGARDLLHGVTISDDVSRTQLTVAEAQLLRDAGQHDAAHAFLEAALAKRTDDAELIYETALSADRVRKFERAESLLQRLIRLRPDNAHAYNALGYTLAERGIRLDEALQLIDKALTLAPDDPFILDSKGWVLYRRGDLRGALSALQQAFSRRPDPEIAAHLGEVLWALGRKPDAQRLWAEVTREHPGNEVLNETIKKFRP